MTDNDDDLTEPITAQRLAAMRESLEKATRGDTGIWSAHFAVDRHGIPCVERIGPLYPQHEGLFDLGASDPLVDFLRFAPPNMADLLAFAEKALPILRLVAERFALAQEVDAGDGSSVLAPCPFCHQAAPQNPYQTNFFQVPHTPECPVTQIHALLGQAENK